MPQSILIVGAGVAGPTLASFVLLSPGPAKELPHITILERSASIRFQGQNIDIRGTGLTIIQKLGLETAIRSSTTNEAGARFVDAQNRSWADGPADKTGKIQTGTADIEILRGRLADILFQRAQGISDEVEKAGGRGVEFLFGDYLSSIDEDGDKVNVTFAKSGLSRSFDIVVGADGLQSSTRRLVWGAENDARHLKSLNMYGAFFSLPAAPTDSLWRRWFHAPGRRGIMIRPGETPDQTTVFMSVINEQDPRLRDVAVNGRKGIEAQKSLMKEYFNDAGWECPRLLREMDRADDFYYDVIGQVKMDKWSKGRIVLLGDAGYCASPISGMGTTLALNGAYNLAGALSKNPNDHMKAMAEYEEKMRPLVEKAQKLPLGGRAHYLINPETAWGIWVMHVVLFLITSSGLLQVVERFSGPPANAVPIPEHRFKTMGEFKEYKRGK